MPADSFSPLIRLTADGSYTLIHPFSGDAYHSMHGAVGESRHVFIDSGLTHRLRSMSEDDRRSGMLRILEIGFGSGLNALATLQETLSCGMQTHYFALELHPVNPKTAASLNYCDVLSGSLDECLLLRKAFAGMHDAPWGKPVSIHPGFSLHKMHDSLLTAPLPGCIDLVYFDAFAPDTQPELWGKPVFVKLYECLNDGGILVTYSSKGSVKTSLRGAGFQLERLQGAPGKRHMLRAVKLPGPTP